MNKMMFPCAIFGICALLCFILITDCEKSKLRREAAYNSGVRAGKADLPVFANPHDGTRFERSWKHGWVQGQLEIKE